MKLIITTLALCCCAFAASKDIQYQEGVLIDFRMVTVGRSCSGSGTVRGDEDELGNVNGSVNTSSSCRDTETRDYTISVGQHMYVIRPSYTGKQRAIGVASLGYSRFFEKRSVLAHQMPGAHLLIGTDEHGCWVKVGKRKSHFEIVAAK
jgi:hypothetical protein